MGQAREMRRVLPLVTSRMIALGNESAMVLTIAGLTVVG
jgi:hypothetical protein